MDNPNASPFHGGLTAASIALLVIGFAASIDVIPVRGMNPIAIFAASIFIFGLSFTSGLKDAGFRPVTAVALSIVLGIFCVGLMLAMVHLASLFGN